MFIVKNYRLEMEEPGCAPGSESWNATARLEYDIDEVFPYLNAVWEGALYNPGGRQMACQRGEHRVALNPRQIIISNVPDHDAATVEMEKLVAEINRIWTDRDHIEPRYTARKRLVAMAIYKLLPQTNCRECGQPSCFAFASQLTVGGVQPDACLPLCREPQYLPQRQALLAMLAEAG